MTVSLEERCQWVAESVHALGRRGAVVQVSGGVDSAVVVRLCARALGPDHVVSLFLPDSATDPASQAYAEQAVHGTGVPLLTRSIAPALQAQEGGDITSILRRYAPEYDPAIHGFAVNASRSTARRLGILHFHVAIGPRYGEPTRRLNVGVEDLRRIIAAQNRKQRTRMLFAYAEAEALNHAVVGASNLDELDSGFVVKYGDDAADLCPIGDLQKSQVYALAEQLDVPRPIIERAPTTDTYAVEQTQEDYYYALPAHVLRALSGLDEAGLADPVTLRAAAPGCEDWQDQALRQLARGLRSTLAYQQARSVRITGDGTPGRITGPGEGETS